jgi:hypothetical protein
MVTDQNPTSTGTDTLEPGDLYVVIRKAVEDAILNVIGTLFMVILALVLVWFGMLVAGSAYDTSPLMAAGGGFVVLVGLYLAASELGIIPSLPDLL